MQSLDLRSRLCAVVRHLPPSTGYRASRIALLSVVHLFLRWRGLDGLDHYRHDPLGKHVVRLERMPDVSTLSRRLTEFDHRTVDNLRGTIRNLAAARAVAESPERLASTFDGSVITTKARGIEGSAVGYNAKSNR